MFLPLALTTGYSLASPNLRQRRVLSPQWSCTHPRRSYNVASLAVYVTGRVTVGEHEECRGTLEQKPVLLWSPCALVHVIEHERVVGPTSVEKMARRCVVRMEGGPTRAREQCNICDRRLAYEMAEHKGTYSEWS